MRAEFGPGSKCLLAHDCERFWARSPYFIENDPEIIAPESVVFLRHFENCKHCCEDFVFLKEVVELYWRMGAA
jgi:hypothetical protein